MEIGDEANLTLHITHTHTLSHTNTKLLTHILILTHANTCTHTKIYTFTHTHTHILPHKHTHTCTHTHTHTLTRHVSFCMYSQLGCGFTQCVHYLSTTNILFWFTLIPPQLKLHQLSNSAYGNTIPQPLHNENNGLQHPSERGINLALNTQKCYFL